MDTHSHCCRKKTNILPIGFLSAVYNATINQVKPAAICFCNKTYTVKDILCKSVKPVQHIAKVVSSYKESYINNMLFYGYMLPNLSPSPDLYKVQSVYNNNVVL